MLEDLIYVIFVTVNCNDTVWVPLAHTMEKLSVIVKDKDVPFQGV